MLQSSRVARAPSPRHRAWNVFPPRVAISGACALLACALLALPRPAAAQDYPRAEVVIHGHTLVVDVADTPDLQVQGLSGRRRLGPDQGMIFVYGDLGDRVFWMRGMFIPIDMIWFNNSRVVHIEPSVPPPRQGMPERQLPTYRAPEHANLVLELTAGRARELGLKVGDRVEFKFR